MSSHPLRLVLADDDRDDCTLFAEVLMEIPLATVIVNVHDGEQLMTLLHDRGNALPDVVFLDLNMPRKNGFECLEEIKQSLRLRAIPVIIFSTTFQKEVVKLLHKNGAQYYICKPDAYNQLRNVIAKALMSILKATEISQPPPESFVLS